MKDDYSLSLEEAAKLLTVSTRTVRRFVQRGQLSKHYQIVRKARELRFSESELTKLREDMSRTEKTASGQNMDNARTSGQTFTGTIDIKDFLQRYEAAVGQLGYYKAKAEEVKLLADQAESLRKENSDLESMRSELEKRLDEKQGQLDQLNKKAQWSTGAVAVLALAIIIAAIVIFVSGFGANFLNR